MSASALPKRSVLGISPSGPASPATFRCATRPDEPQAAQSVTDARVDAAPDRPAIGPPRRRPRSDCRPSGQHSRPARHPILRGAVYDQTVVAERELGLLSVVTPML